MKKQINRTYFYLYELVKAVNNGSIPLAYRLGIEQTNELVNVAKYCFNTTSTITGYLSETLSNQLWCRYIACRNLNEIIYYDDESEDFSQAKVQEWFQQFVYILNATYPVYSTLLTNYDAQINNLLNQISDTTLHTYNRKTTFDTDDTNKSTNEHRTGHLVNNQWQDGTNDVETRINNTPQNGGEFTADDYTSGYQIAKQKYDETTTVDTSDVKDQETSDTGTITDKHDADGGTVMERLAELRDKWENLFRAWANEFRTLFLED